MIAKMFLKCLYGENYMYMITLLESCPFPSSIFAAKCTVHK